MYCEVLHFTEGGTEVLNECQHNQHTEAKLRLKSGQTVSFPLKVQLRMKTHVNESLQTNCILLLRYLLSDRQWIFVTDRMLITPGAWHVSLKT